MKCDNIYVDYDDYDKLEDVYDNETTFYNAVTLAMATYNLGWISSVSDDITKLKTLIGLMAYPIYKEYHTDQIAYENRTQFLERMLNSISRKVGKWYMQHKIDEGLLNNATLEKFIVNGGTHSITEENASTGSSVIQKSASTPTGITHDAETETIDLELSHDDTSDTTSLEVTDDYDDKYTNFIGKTSGNHRNEVDRDTDITRTSNYGLAMEILNQIPYSYINDVLSEVSIHFIQVY